MASPYHIARALIGNRRLPVLLLLAATLFAQSAALVSAHLPHSATEHCCVLCHVCHPAVKTSVPAAVVPLVYVRWLPPAAPFEFFHDVFRPADSSRGPPALS